MTSHAAPLQHIRQHTSQHIPALAPLELYLEAHRTGRAEFINDLELLGTVHIHERGRGSPCSITWSYPEPIRERADIDIRQLRHHTKNALQRIMGLVSGAPGLSGTPEGERIARMLERRIQLSAEVSDALFGLTHAPASMTVRLKSLCGNLVELLADGAQSVRVRVEIGRAHV